MQLAIWEITLECNLKCIHCGSNAGKRREKELSTKEALKLCEELANLGCKGVALFGGEPFLRNDWYEIGRRIKELGMKLSIVTNGFLNKAIRELEKLEVDSLHVSIHGTEKIHDRIEGRRNSFRRAVEFLHLAKNSGLNVSVITAVQKKNFEELPKLKEFILKENVEWQIQEVLPMGRADRGMVLSPEQYYAMILFIESIRKEIRVIIPHNMGINSNRFGCLAGKDVVGIRSDGKVKACLALPDSLIEGDVTRENIGEIWDKLRRKYEKEMKCKDCIHVGCKGGCLARIHYFGGKDPYCLRIIESKLFKHQDI